MSRAVAPSWELVGGQLVVRVDVAEEAAVRWGVGPREAGQPDGGDEDFARTVAESDWLGVAPTGAW